MTLRSAFFAFLLIALFMGGASATYAAQPIGGTCSTPSDCESNACDISSHACIASSADPSSTTCSPGSGHVTGCEKYGAKAYCDASTKKCAIGECATANDCSARSGYDASCPANKCEYTASKNVSPGTGNTVSPGTSNPVTPGTANPGKAGKQSLQNPLKNISSLPELLEAILHAVVNLGTIALVLALVWVGAQFVFAQGNEERIKSARDSLMWTVIGGLILLGAEAISLVIQSTVNSL